ncbi:hypothetical protein IBE20_01065 [Francisella tularensis subsp. novicida]|uniref:Lipoprotein n=2 Tax=Francisella tularensis TaxID=263 RepID=A0A6I4RX49_FRATU|nr:hypothetical protein [Francisella tularensis]ABK89893.1 hypothetical protein FTN_1005 [Francisella tularensis subsp. novicida U112]AJI61379.1 hypothetical protein AW25_1004 [Francisella tularensis subsp. novicida U112]AJI72832.1 hypothetical protein AQ14_1674 [Francisella tularensis subsp. novicida D9876]APC94816.1 hypothetical protein KX02_764 [Francisella tularensis subsp. novicida]AVC44216.1 hypothetical protein B4919_05185 [Francisella tularensis subsp. novicida]
MSNKIINNCLIWLSVLSIVGCNTSFTYPNYQLSGTYYNPDYNKDDLIHGYFQQSVEQMETSPYTYQGQYYEETGFTQPSPFMQNINWNRMNV